MYGESAVYLRPVPVVRGSKSGPRTLDLEPRAL